MVIFFKIDILNSQKFLKMYEKINFLTYINSQITRLNNIYKYLSTQYKINLDDVTIFGNDLGSGSYKCGLYR